MTDASAPSRVVLVEDDPDLRASTAQLLTLAGYAVESFPAAPAALDAIDADFPGVVVTDIRMPMMSGLELFRALHARDATLPVILVTGHADVAMAVDALKAGAWDFLTKPFDPAALVAAVGRAATARGLALDNRRLRAAVATGGGDDVAAGLIGRSPAIRRLREMIPVLAGADIDLFVEGETGTGKELLARLIHRAGKRARHRFVAIACAALPDALIDGELFGSGEGGVQASSRGTLFLDDVDRAPARLQARLVALVEERMVRLPGGRDATPLDLRVIATGGEGGGAGIVPELFYRLAAVRLRLPPLRERREDVPLLFAHLVDASAARLRVPIPTLTAAARDRLAGHDWPGNVRELAHFADRFVLGLEEGVVDDPADAGNGTLPDRVAAFERDAIVAAVRDAGGEIGVAMSRLGLPRKTFYYKVQRHGIDLPALRRRLREG